jgi:outer membrane protein OmpA-like peptidoglycan-associated protein
MDEERLAYERQASADAQARSQAQANDANRLKNQAEADTAKAQSDSAQAKSDLAATQAASAAAIATAQADAERARLAALQAQSAAEADKTAMRLKLAEQLNSILQTRDSARGLIVNMSDVLFDSGKFSLKPGAREKLSKVAGILLAYPELDIAVGGYTDTVGSDAMNQKLSENRATSVRDYLVQQGVPSGTVTAAGFGKTLPVATNDNAAGRQQNRRVELVVSGEAIGRVATTSSLQ